MSCFYPILIVGIGGCWSLPLPSSLTLVWSLQDDGQNQTSFLCLVPGVYNVAGMVWFLNGNQSRPGAFHVSTLKAATLRLSSNRQYLLQYDVTGPHILVPLNHSSPSCFENLKTCLSSESPTAVYGPSLPNTLLSSWEFSIPSNVNKAFIPSLDGYLEAFNPPPFTNENVSPLLPSLHIQDLGAQISHIVSPETLHFSALSTDKFPDAVTCFVIKTGHDMLGKHEIISGETDQPSCKEDKPPVELGLRVCSHSGFNGTNHHVVNRCCFRAETATRMNMLIVPQHGFLISVSPYDAECPPSTRHKDHHLQADYF